MANHPRRDEVRLAGYKLVSLLSFRGRKGDAAARTLVSASIWRDSVEGKSGTYGVSAQTVRNYVEDQGLSVIGDVLEEVRGISAKMLEGARRIDLSLDWTGIRYYGNYVDGLGSGDKGYSWNYATATTKYRGRILLLAFSPYVRGMSEVGIVRSLIEQVLSLGFRIRTVALDSGFYSVGVVRYISRFKFILAVPVGDVGIHGEFDGRYRTRSKRLAADEQVDFRLIVSRRRAGLGPAGHRRRGPEYVAGATNLELPGRDVLRLYDRIRAPIETSYRDIKSFLLFTSSTKGDLQALRLPPRGAHLLLLHPLQGQPEEGGVQAAAGAGSHPGDGGGRDRSDRTVQRRSSYLP